MKHVLITGISGFTGQHLAKYLSTRFHVLGTYFKHPLILPKSKKFSQVRLDILDRKKVYRLLKTYKPDIIYHFSALTSVPYCNQHPEKAFETNVVGTLNLLDAVRNHARNSTVLFASSIQSYGKILHSGHPFKETDKLWPETIYASSKVLSELACLDFAQRYRLHIIIARACNHLGPGMSKHNVFSDWCDQVVQAEKQRRVLTLKVGNTKLIREFLHIDDIVRAYETLAAKGKPGQIYNVCSEKPRSLNVYLNQLITKANTPVTVQIDPTKLRRLDPPIIRGSAKRLKALGWKPRRNPIDGIAELLHDMRQKTKIIKE